MSKAKTVPLGKPQAGACFWGPPLSFARGLTLPSHTTDRHPESSALPCLTAGTPPMGQPPGHGARRRGHLPCPGHCAGLWGGVAMDPSRTETRPQNLRKPEGRDEQRQGYKGPSYICTSSGRELVLFPTGGRGRNSSRKAEGSAFMPELGGLALPQRMEDEASEEAVTV